MCAVERHTRSDFPNRWTVTNEVKAALLHIYCQTQYPSADLRLRLADQLGVSSKQVQVWFRNQRQREKNPVWKRQMQAANYMPFVPPMQLYSAGGLNQVSAAGQGQYFSEDQMVMNGAAYGAAGICTPIPGYCGYPHFSTSMQSGAVPAPHLLANPGVQYHNMSQQYEMAQHAMTKSQETYMPAWPSPSLFVPGALAPLQGQQQLQLQPESLAKQQPQQQQGLEHQLQPHEQPGLPGPPHSYYPTWLNVHFKRSKKDLERVQQQQATSEPQAKMLPVHPQTCLSTHSHGASLFVSTLEKPCKRQKSSFGCDTSFSATAPAAAGGLAVPVLGAQHC
mmetsp:Transcript_35326/g.67949  ORF Transcript_35326/g.67949 Transcript_35326/m.67949 type:complete len:335 (+) Transcript_35326:201-1205(+)